MNCKRSGARYEHTDLFVSVMRAECGAVAMPK
jgi:hypothetical protein